MPSRKCTTSGTLLLTFCFVTAAEQPPGTQPLAFDAASIKTEVPLQAQVLPGGRGIAAPPGVTLPSGRLQFSTGRVAGTGITARRLVQDAYRLPPLQLSGGPYWLDVDRFDIDARAPGPAEDADLRLMLRTLLAERFKLVVHHEQKVIRTDTLVVAKGGPKLEEWKEGQPLPTRTQKKNVIGVYRDHGTMAHLAEVLSADPTAWRPVVDKTGLSGVYVLHLEWQENGSMRSALPDLGLKIRGARATVDLLVLDRIEKPDDN